MIAASPGRASSPGRGGVARIAMLLLVAAPIVFNAILLWPELSVRVPSLNDDAVHYLLVQRASEALAAGENPFDHWSPEIDLGFPTLLYYQHLPHLTVVALHRVLFEQVDLLTLFNAVRYLLLVGLPLTVYWSMRQLGFSRMAAAVGAAASSLLSANSKYGFEYDSYTWKGWGMYTQLWAMHLSFLTLGSINRLLERGRGYIAAILACSALVLSHLIYSYMMVPGVLVLFLVGLGRANLRERIARLAIVATASLAITAYFWFPFLRYAAYLSASPYEAAWKYTSFGAGPILTWLVDGDLLDYGRLPVLTLLAALGLAIAVVTRSRPALLAVAFMTVWLALFFGQPTWGAALNILPMHERLHFHRFIGGVHLAAILLMGLGGEFVWRALAGVPPRWRDAAAVVVVLAVLAPAAYERYPDYAYNTQLMEETRQALAENDDARTILATVASLPPGRVSAGRRDNWGKEMRIGSVSFYDLLAYTRVPSTTTYGTFSLNSDLIWHLDDQVAEHYDLFDIRYVVAPREKPMAGFLQPIKETARYTLYRANTTGYAAFANVTGERASATQAVLFGQNRDWMASADLRAGRFVRQDFPEPDAAGVLPQGGCPGGTTEDGAIGPGRYDVHVSCPSASTVVLKISYHPNWRVAVDGRDVPTYMLSPSFIGVAVPPGAHDIRAEYHAAPGKNVLVVFGAAVLLGLAVFRRRIPRFEARLAGRR